jgi:hypothetical protein
VFAPLGIVLADWQGTHSGAMPEQARGEHARVIQDEAIAGGQEPGEVAEMAVFPSPFGAAQHQHACACAVRERLLGNEFFGKMIIEFGGVQPSMYRLVDARLSAPFAEGE